MANKDIESDWSYKIGYIIGSLIFSFFIFLWDGLKASFKNKYMLILYAFFILLAVLSVTIFNDISVMLAVILLTFFIYCVCHSIKEYPTKKRRKYFNRLFQQIKLTQDDTTPYYLYETQLSDFAVEVAFISYIPLSAWNAKKELLETHMNAKIIDIKQEPDNYQKINLIIQTEPLPQFAEWSDRYIDLKQNTLTIGVSYYGLVSMDLEKQPHAFIAGETGSGKSNILKCMIHQALLKHYEVVLIDFKRGVSFSSFGKAVTVYYDYKDIIMVIKEMILETTRRLDKFRSAGVDNINDYNRITADFLPRKVVFIDELAELLKTRDKELTHILNDSLETLTRLSRAVGIHLIMGLQRPDSTIVSGQIKNNVSYRICGRFVDREPSRIMLGSDIASDLPNIKGRFIVKDNDFYEVQCFYFSHETKISNAQTDYIVNGESKEDINDTEPIQQTEPKQIPDPPFKFDFSDMKK